MTIPATQKLFNVLIHDLATNSRDKAKFRAEMKKLIHDVAVQEANCGKQATAQVVADYWATYVTEYVRGFEDEKTMKANKKHDIDNPALTVKEYLKAETGYTFESNRPKFAAVKDGSASYAMEVKSVKAKDTSAADVGGGDDHVPVVGSFPGAEHSRKPFESIDEGLNALICDGFGPVAIFETLCRRLGFTAAQAKKMADKAGEQFDKTHGTGQ